MRVAKITQFMGGWPIAVERTGHTFRPTAADLSRGVESLPIGMSETG
jgi:hypothetical protein